MKKETDLLRERSSLTLNTLGHIPGSLLRALEGFVVEKSY